MALWEQIAGISYSGDPRMNFPGAENPEKVKNIVRGEGQLEAFRELYKDVISEIDALSWAGEEKMGLRNWRGNGAETLVVRFEIVY
jgi:mitochondrial translocator assembly and maintenance protein 41